MFECAHTHTEISHSLKKTNRYWNKFYNFAFVRNPYDRAVSSWKFGSWKDNWNCSFEEYTFKILEVQDLLNQTHPDEGISEELWGIKQSPTPGLLHHSTKQYNYIYPEKGDCKVNFIGKVENYRQDLNLILKENNLPEVGWTPHRNKTKKSEYQLYYNSQSKKNIEKIYEKDIETFKYLF